jgi:hypothetical protein
LSAARTCKSIRELLICLALVVATGATAGPQDDAAWAEALVKRVYFEGLPYDSARELKPAGIARLAQMLADTEHVEHHANVVMALGMSERPAAYAPLERYARAVPSGEIARSAYRARMALPFALGHLARADRRALRLLESMLQRRDPPAWSYHRQRGERLRAQLERSAISGLALSGLPEALDGLDARASDPALKSHVESARRLCARIEREGAGRVFGRAAGP